MRFLCPRHPEQSEGSPSNGTSFINRRGSFVAALLWMTVWSAAFALDLDNSWEMSQGKDFELQQSIDPRLPVSSRAHVGKVISQKIKELEFSQPIFIIGDDSFSWQWLEKKFIRQFYKLSLLLV